MGLLDVVQVRVEPGARHFPVIAIGFYCVLHAFIDIDTG